MVMEAGRRDGMLMTSGYPTTTPPTLSLHSHTSDANGEQLFPLQTPDTDYGHNLIHVLIIYTLTTLSISYCHYHCVSSPLLPFPPPLHPSFLPLSSTISSLLSCSIWHNFNPLLTLLRNSSSFSSASFLLFLLVHVLFLFLVLLCLFNPKRLSSSSSSLSFPLLRFLLLFHVLLYLLSLSHSINKTTPNSLAFSSS